MANKYSVADVVQKVSVKENIGAAHTTRKGNFSKYYGRTKSINWARRSGVIFRITCLTTQDEVHIVQIIRMECPYPDRSRFLVIACNESAKGYCLLGVDCVNLNEDDTNRKEQRDKDKIDEPTETIGLVIKLSSETVPIFDGDGGFKIRYEGRSFLFKPVSLQALWTIIQMLNMITDRLTPQERRSLISLENLDLLFAMDSSKSDNATTMKYDWVKYYQNMINSPQCCLDLWDQFEDILSKRPASTSSIRRGPFTKLYDEEDAEAAIKSKLRSIMRHVDLDRITSKVIRKQLENEMGESLDQYRAFIDKEIILVLGQMDPASKILDYLYLGSEWNASNFDELKQNNITHILNVTREIDNFYPASFKYKNIRVWDLGKIQQQLNLIHISTYEILLSALPA